MAVDKGGGLAEAGLSVDGQRVLEPLDDNGGACHPLAGAPGLAYSQRVPCVLRASVSSSFDTTTLTNGAHKVAVYMKDAAGNEVTTTPVDVVVDNSAAGGGSGGGGGGSSPAASAGGGGQVAPSFFGSSPGFAAGSAVRGRPTIYPIGRSGVPAVVGAGVPVVVRGRLVDEGGRAIPNASLNVLTTVRRPGAPKALAGVTTDAAGMFSYTVAPGASRDVAIAYLPRPADPEYSASLRTAVLVRAAVRLSRSRARLRNGQLLTLTARLSGEGIRARAAKVAFQVQLGPRWKTFGISPIDRKGRARVSHRFRYTTIPLTYRFRAVTLRSSRFPYLPGTSRSVRVRVRP